ncbi:methylenetetrahydrofolate reductase [Streptomyces sp. NL15-2K]|uniref:methylenetetrahydrofolate reductase n=1 Tax=Streptomyces sp. NL15-2K TaxID=376149 RepID=UPI00209C6131|nr:MULTISPECIES: methylenetetrahydrofolate reductase [Actinomycetes]WKX13308.1 methylenetetrahydrofolate reductase [Kutzneria buriramensis]
MIADHSIEITGKDVAALGEVAAHFNPGTAVNVTYLGNESLSVRIEACRAARGHGFRPVPHLAARRITGEAELRQFLSALREVGANEEVFVIGGDPAEPHGPYGDALALIRTGLLQEYGVRHVGITGYPEGHPHIDDSALWDALEHKIAAATEQSMQVSVTTQFGFNSETVIQWIELVRGRGITVPIRVGVPGPASIQRLLGYARRFGVKSSAGIVGKYGISLTRLVGSAGPDRFIDSLAGRLTPDHGPVLVHFYTFGHPAATAAWVSARKERIR